MKTWADYKKDIMIDEGYAVIMTTDSFIVDSYPLSAENEAYLAEKLNDRLLDMRIFNCKSEFKLFRGAVSDELRMRILTDTDNDEDTYCDEQYLDIDDKRSAECFARSGLVRATGGGYYRLPLESFKDVKLIIKNYVAYDDNGQAYIRDWRLCDFVNDKEVKHG